MKNFDIAFVDHLQVWSMNLVFFEWDICEGAKQPSGGGRGVSPSHGRELLHLFLQILPIQLTSTGKRVLHYKNIYLTFMRKQATISNWNISIWLHMAMITLIYYILVVLSAFHIGTLEHPGASERL